MKKLKALDHINETIKKCEASLEANCFVDISIAKIHWQRKDSSIYYEGIKAKELPVMERAMLEKFLVPFTNTAISASDSMLEIMVGE